MSGATDAGASGGGRIRLAWAVAVACLAVPLPALAAHEEPRGQQTGPQAPSPASPWRVGARLTGALFSADSLDTTAGISGFATYSLAPDFEVELEVAVVRPGTVVDTLPEGDLTVVPIRGSLRYRVWRWGELVPYAAGGAGIYINDFSLDSSAASRLEALGFTVSQEVDTGLGAHLGGGVEWERGRWSLELDAKYVFGSADTSAQVIDQITGLVATESGDLDLDGLWVAVGFRVRI